MAGHTLHVRFFQNLFVRAGNDFHLHAAAREFAPAILLIEGAEKLVPGTAKERHFAGIGSRLIADERANMRFPKAALVLRVRGEIDERVNIKRPGVPVTGEEALSAFGGGANFPADKIAPLLGCPGQRIAQPIA